MSSLSDFEQVNADEITPLIDRRNQSDGYTRRRQTDQDGRFINTDHGSYLAIDRQTSQPVIVEEDPNELTGSMRLLETPTSIAVNMCQEKVIRPYRILLLLVGWAPVFEDAETCVKKMLNIVHPGIVMALVMLGYIIQYSCCFRRDSSGISSVWRVVYPAEGTFPNGTEKENLTDVVPSCDNVAISQYLIPDLLHSAAYLYSFYILRFKLTENLSTLTTRTFLQTSLTQKAFWSQGRLIRIMRASLYLSVIWVLMSLASQIIHVIAIYTTIRFQWFHPAETDVFAKVLLIVFMLVSFVALDVVYVLVVLNYCVQCLLLIFFIEGLQEKIKRREFGLKRAMQEIAEVQDHLRVLNFNTGIALSIVLFNFGTMAVLGFIEIFSPHAWVNQTLMYISTILSVVFWLSIMLVPFIQAARLSAACNSLRKLGHEIRAKAFAYQHVSAEELDSFLLFTSTLNMRAKIFLFPIQTSYMALITVTTCFVLLLLFQMGVIDLHVLPVMS